MPLRKPITVDCWLLIVVSTSKAKSAVFFNIISIM